MRHITINDAAMAAIRGAVADGHVLAQTARRVGPDEWSVPLQDSTHARMQELRLPGETDSDLIIRCVAYMHAKGRLN